MNPIRRNFLKTILGVILSPFLPRTKIISKENFTTLPKTEWMDLPETNNLQGLPLPIIHQDFTFQLRTLEQIARDHGVSLDFLYKEKEETDSTLQQRSEDTLEDGAGSES